jgi:hypothetical protein
VPHSCDQTLNAEEIPASNSGVASGIFHQLPTMCVCSLFALAPWFLAGFDGYYFAVASSFAFSLCLALFSSTYPTFF